MAKTQYITKYSALFHYQNKEYTPKEIVLKINKLPKDLLRFQFTVDDYTAETSTIKEIECKKFANQMQAFQSAILSINKEISNNTSFFHIEVHNFMCFDMQNRKYMLPDPVVKKERVKVVANDFFD